ncbi:MAG TPA: family 10 glycosylhydrolase, partial [Planctomycetota bacterium]|nr:family 10 glycosylhydrolase [Planctomycetota bacterium]
WLAGEQGRAPEPPWDPLQFAIEGAHARGLELHAWFNPYRARHAKATSPTCATHVARRTDWCVEYDGHLWLDPGRAEARDHTLAVIADVVRRYDVDGVHIDDYFYPYPVAGRAFPDDRSFAAAQRAGWQGSRADWRRRNVEDMVAAIARVVREHRPRARFGISPFGIARPGVPPGITAGIDQYDQLYADVCKWLREGICDYLSPQLYWPVAQTRQSYARLLAWWPTVNVQSRHLWIGNYTGKAGSPGWPREELLDQIARTRKQRGTTGNVHFSMRALLEDRAGIATALRRGPYAERALVPASPWLDAHPPAAPKLVTEPLADGRVRLRPSAAGDDDVRFFALYLHDDDGWRLADVRGGDATFVLPSKSADYAVTAIDLAGNESAPAR